MKPQTVVERRGVRGVVVSDPWGVCGPGEIPVVFEGVTHYQGTPEGELVVIGPENAVADFKLCGAGSAECCIFLTVGAGGPECARFGGLRNAIIMRKSEMRAQREPVEMFPRCQLP